MARIRTIKPEFWTDEKLVLCTRDARLFFIGLLNFADDEGRLEDSPRRLKMQVFPGDDLTAGDIDGFLNELVQQRIICRYVAEGRCCISISGFSKHQRVKHPTPSRLPACSEGDALPIYAGDENPPPALPEDCGSPTPALPQPSPTYREREREREVIHPAAAVAAVPTPKRAEQFERFWSAYPRKKGKQEALKVWARKRLDPRADELIADVTNRAANDRQWLEGFVPHGDTYLRQERWQDEVETPTANGAPAAAPAYTLPTGVRW